MYSLASMFHLKFLTFKFSDIGFPHRHIKKKKKKKQLCVFLTIISLLFQHYDLKKKKS